MKRSHLHSQHFIRRPQLIKTLIGHSNIKKTDTVYDIGAGSGVISSVLAAACHQVVAVEFDTRVIPKLRENTAKYSNIEVIEANFLDVDLPDSPYKVFANIPFHLSSPILRKLTESDNAPDAIYLIVQKQFAKKLIIGDNSFTGLLGAMVAPWFTTRIRYQLEKTDFWPHPAVETVFIEILRRDQALIEPTSRQFYYEFVELCFSRQKFFEKFKLPKRPSKLTAEEWTRLFQSQSSHKR